MPKEHAIALGIPMLVHTGTTPIEAGGVLHPKEDKWQTEPPHWTDKSRSKFYKSMSQKEGPTTNCMNKIGNHVSDPGAFCASLRDRVTGTTKWRHGGGKKSK